MPRLPPGLTTRQSRPVTSALIAPLNSSIRHEVRTPLNHILGYCELLLEEAEERSLREWTPGLWQIHSAGSRLLVLSENLFGSPGTDTADPGRFIKEWHSQLDLILDLAQTLLDQVPAQGMQPFVEDIERIRTASRKLRRLLPGLAREEGTGGTPTVGAGASSTSLLRNTQAEENRPEPVGLTGLLLVVDDDEANREMLARRLTRLGHTVLTAENGRVALEILRSNRCDVLLLDLQMPEMDGEEVLRQLRADPAWRSLPVIVLSASDEIERVVRCIEQGAEDYLSKPFNPVLLQARIRACLEKKLLRDREAAHLLRIQDEKRRSDELLHVILPHDVAEELKCTQSVRPRRVENVGVLFCDIVGFTAWCERQTPEAVHHELQSLVEAFEQLAADHGLEKIKTIGDSFMATAGLLAPLDHPALNCAACGLAMIQAARSLPPRWEVRLGLHVGPVIAGIVGRRKYQYDVWGDTVNTAARLEQVAPPGTVCVEATLWHRLSDRYHGEALGLVQLKGKGAKALYRIDGILP